MDSYHRYRDVDHSLEYLIECWIRERLAPGEYDWAIHEPVLDARDDPERAWDFIRMALSNSDCQPHLDVLAAGPLEELLSRHGKAFIDRVEAEAQQSAAFAHLLGGVWQGRMSDDIWSRVRRVWNRSGWDGGGDAV